MLAISSFCVLLCISVGVLAQTTPFLQQVFLGKCYGYNPVGTNCTLLWEYFSSAAEMDNTVVTIADYAPFLELANFSTAPSRALFWSGNMAFAIAVASNDPRFVTVEETPTGYVMNGLIWCGVPSANPPEFNYAGPCPYPTTSTYFGMQSVWGQISAYFAQAASGDINVLLQPQLLYRNSGLYQAYRNTSIFSQIEVPNMNVSKITSINILVLVNLTTAPNEVCGQGSLLVLQNQIYDKFGFNSTCEDDPEAIYNLFCPPGITSAECIAATLVYNGPAIAAGNNQDQSWAISTTVLLGVFFLATLILAAVVVRARAAK